MNRPTDPRIADFLSTYTEQVAPIAARRGEAWWQVATTGSEEAAAELETAAAEYERLHADSTRYELIVGWLEDDEVELDEQTRRCLQRLRHEFEARQADGDALAEIAGAEARLSRQYGVFRGEIDGEAADGATITRILHESDDSTLRQKAWEASHAVGDEVREPILELVRKRNAIARDLGYDDAYAMRMALQEIDPQWLDGVLTKLERATREPFRTRKAVLDGELADRFGVEVEELRPWHYADPFFQRAPQPKSFDIDAWYAGADLVDLAVRFFDGVGTNVRDVIARSDLEPRQGKNQHAFCGHVDRRGDIRVLANLRPDSRSMTTLLHELGHAIYERYLGDDLPWILRRPSHTLTTEAIAMLMGRQATDPTFLIEYAGAPAFEVTPLSGELRRRQSLAMMLHVRWVLVMVNFERALYADPDRDDLDALWWELKQKYQLVHSPDGERGADWAAKIHLALAPVYYHNYLLGELMASQLRAAILEESRDDGIVDSLFAGEWLITRVFALGASMKWDALVEHATGEPLGTTAFLDEFVGRRS